ncbi:hypothetical protein BZA77DRAFT_360604 [Pyronema omphalodes]|nr:hypothetical protein BZA77DRAFT_360604 [Pyronema omphalodes]
MTSSSARKLRRKSAREALKVKDSENSEDSPTKPMDSVKESRVEPEQQKTGRMDIDTAVSALAIENSEPAQQLDDSFMVQLEREMGQMLWPNYEAEAEEEEKAGHEVKEEVKDNDSKTSDTAVAIDSDDFITRLDEGMARLIWNSENEAGDANREKEKEKKAENSASKPTTVSMDTAEVTEAAMHTFPMTEIQRKAAVVRFIAELCRLIAQKPKEQQNDLISKEKEQSKRARSRIQFLRECQKQRQAVMEAAKRKREEMNKLRKQRETADLAKALKDYPSDVSEVDFPDGPVEINTTEDGSTKFQEVSKESQLDTQQDNNIGIKVEPSSTKKRKITDFFPTLLPMMKRPFTTMEYMPSKEKW